MPPQLVRNSGTHGWLQSPPTLTLEWMDGVHSKKALICKILCKIFQITIMKTEKACSLLNISIKRFHAMLKSMYYYILFMWSSLGFPLVRGDWGRRPPLPPVSTLFNPIWETMQSNYSAVRGRGVFLGHSLISIKIWNLTPPPPPPKSTKE